LLCSNQKNAVDLLRSLPSLVAAVAALEYIEQDEPMDGNASSQSAALHAFNYSASNPMMN
jgi:hypothetical protein